MTKDLSVEKIGKEWQRLGYCNGWKEGGIEEKIYREVCARGGDFVDDSTPTGYHKLTCEEFLVEYERDSSG